MMAMAMEPLRSATMVTPGLEMEPGEEEERGPNIVVEWLTFLQLGQYSRKGTICRTICIRNKRYEHKRENS